MNNECRPFEGHVPRVIVEGNALSDDEEDKIVEGAVFDQIASDFSLNDEISAEEAGQGKLVEQIRSAQKRLDPSADAVSKAKQQFQYFSSTFLFTMLDFNTRIWRVKKRWRTKFRVWRALFKKWHRVQCHWVISFRSYTKIWRPCF